MALERPAFPAVVDSFMLGYWRACPRKFWWRHIRNLAPKDSNIHLHSDRAFAKGLEAARKAFYDGGCTPNEAIIQGHVAVIRAWDNEDVPQGENKFPGRLLGGLDFYLHEAFPLESDNIVPFQNPSTRKPMVECSFGVPIDEVSHPISGDPILYAGRFAMLGVNKVDQVLFIESDKMTSRLDASWSSRWALSGQITGYVWGAQHFGLPIAGAVIRGISFLENGYDKAESIQMRPQWMIDRWYGQVIKDLEEMKRSWEFDSWSYNLDESCAAYGGCPFLRLCDVRDPEPLESIYFENSVWSPFAV